MQDFILQQNAARFRARLSEARDEDERARLQVMLCTVERELALLEAQKTGAGAPPWPIGPCGNRDASRARLLADFRATYEQAPQVAYLIDPGPGLCFVAVNAAFEHFTGVSREQAEGRPLFALFPDNPDDANADGVWRLYDSMRRVAETRRASILPAMRYDLRDAAGVYEERYWRDVNSPLFNEDGRLIFLLHVAEEVTEEVLKGKLSAP